MYDIPFQTIKNFEDSLKIAKDLPITHISIYNLTFEKETEFFNKKDMLKKYVHSNKTSAKLFKNTISYLKKYNFFQYEISAFAKKGYMSNHNLGYWIGREFLGFGPSAFSYFGGKRFKNVSNLYKYFNNIKNDISPIDFEEKLKYPKNVKELLAINLRVLSGVDIKEFQKKHTLPKDTIKTLEELKKDGFLEMEKTNLKLSDKGILFYDLIATDIV